MSRSNGPLICLAVTMIGMGTGSRASASAFTVTPINNSTGLVITGAKNENFEVLALNPAGGLLNVFVTTGNTGTVTVSPIQTTPTSPAEVMNLSEPNLPVQKVVLFSPGSNIVDSTYVLAAASSLTSGANVFALSGGYTTVDTNVDFNPSSSTYGIETGFLSALSIQASGSAGTVEFNLASNPTYSVDLGPIWGENIPEAGLSVPINVTFSGTLLFDSIPSPFSGTFSGTDTFFSDGTTTDQGTISFATDFGLFTGNLEASALPVLQPVPEPSSLFMTCIALCCIALQIHRRQARRHN